jgi:hypothetical protein
VRAEKEVCESNSNTEERLYVQHSTIDNYLRAIISAPFTLHGVEVSVGIWWEYMHFVERFPVFTPTRCFSSTVVCGSTESGVGFKVPTRRPLTVQKLFSSNKLSTPKFPTFKVPALNIL